VPRRQRRELSCGVGDAQPLLQLAAVTGREQAQVVDTSQAAWTPRPGRRAAGEGACCCAQRGEGPGQPAGRSPRDYPLRRSRDGQTIFPIPPAQGPKTTLSRRFPLARKNLNQRPCLHLA
jgi:hypothetical protein